MVTGYANIPKRKLVSIGLLSTALIAYQVAIVLMLSYSQWHHFASMVISIALLGFGAAGTVLSLMRDWFVQRYDKIVPLLMIFAGLSMTVAVDATQSEYLHFDSYLVFIDGTQWVALLGNYLFYFFPFLFGGLAIGLIFTHHVTSIGRLYAADLIGASLGGIGASVAAWYLLPQALPAAIALAATVAGVLFMERKPGWIALVVFLVGTTYSLWRIAHPVELRRSQYKSLSRVMNLPSAVVRHQRPGPYGMLDVVSAEGLRYAPGISLAFTGSIPVEQAVFNNGDWIGPVASWHPGDTSHLLQYTTAALPYAIRKPGNVLIVNAGTGMQVSHALYNTVTAITAVEPHEGLVKALKGELASVNDSLFYDSGIQIFITEPRTFLQSTRNTYELIELPMVGTFGGSSGLYAMREEYMLTKESFAQVWSHLDPNGMVAVTCWMDYPFRNSLKLVATFSEMLHEIDVDDPSLHFVAIRSWGTVTFVLKKLPFSFDEIARVRAFCTKWYFDPLLLPGLDKRERSAYNTMMDTSFFSYVDKLMYGEKATVYKEYDFHLKPATDDKPYFSQFIRWRSIPHLASIFGSQAVPFLEVGLLMSALTFSQISILALALIIVPLSRIGWKGRTKPWAIIYFGSIGMGYMLLEIVFIQKLILFFGNPVYTVSFVIAVMLLFSGIGSVLSSRVGLGRLAIQRILLSIVVILLAYMFILQPLLYTFMDFGVLIKTLLSAFVVALPAFFMGMAFPLGLRLCASADERSVPWAWGINGCASVVAAPLAALLAVEAGFTVVIASACVFYCLSLVSLFVFPWSKRSG